MRKMLGPSIVMGWWVVGGAVACGTSHASGASNACDDYFAAVQANPCGTGPTLPATEVSRLRTRFEQVCADSKNLPGSGMTDDRLEACAQALQASGCTESGTIPEACDVVGSLAARSSCNENFQCQSGLCFSAAPVGEAGATPGACGTCEPLASLGQPCTDNCVAGTVCNTATSNPTCQTVILGAAGATCNGLAEGCGPGLYCASPSFTCTPLPAADQPCTANAQCAFPATCVGVTCASPGGAGAACDTDTDCVAGLGCSEQTSTCGAVTWASGGQPCGDLTRCLVGECPGGSCPTVIGDGQACNAEDPTQTCDTYARCTSGVCVLSDSETCM